MAPRALPLAALLLAGLALAAGRPGGPGHVKGPGHRPPGTPGDEVKPEAAVETPTLAALAGDDAPSAQAATDAPFAASGAEPGGDDPAPQAALVNRRDRRGPAFGGSGLCAGGCNSDYARGGALQGRILSQQMLDAGIQNPAHCCILCQQRADCAGWNYCDSNAGCWSPTTPMPYARGSCELRAFGAAVKDAGLASWTHGVKDCDGAPPLDTHVEIEL